MTSLSTSVMSSGCLNSGNSLSSLSDCSSNLMTLVSKSSAVELVSFHKNSFLEFLASYMRLTFGSHVRHPITMVEMENEKFAMLLQHCNGSSKREV